MLNRRTFVGLAAGSALAPVPVAAQTDARLLRIVAPWEITGLDPVRSGYIFQRMQVAETLVGADDAGAPLPGLATQWDISDDRLQWRFVLRRGARFHDGAPVEAPHVVRVLERTRTPPGLLSATPIASIAAEAGAVVIRTTRPFMALTAFLAHSNTIILAPAAYDSAGAVRQIIGSGPFRAVEVTPPLRIETARFEGWSGAAPAIARASYLAVSRGETRALMADGGQAELVYTLDPASIERLRRNRRLDVRIMAIPRTQLMKFNAGGPFFGDVRVRRAVGFAIDREGIARAILRNPAAAATQLFPPTLAEWHVPELPKLRHDPAMARSLLAAAGWSPGSDQVLQREGRPFRVTLRTFPDRPELPVIAAAIQDQLRSVGIDMQIAVANSSEIPAGHRDGTLDLGLMARNFSLVPDPIGTLLTDFGPGGGDWGAMGWSSGELVETLARLGAVSETAERRALRRRTSEILQSELPVMPIGWYDHSVAVSRSLTEVSVDPLELSYRIAAMRWAG